ncbi:MAG TPA: bifunctional (p)ppGpp synthetase/guanosine-3',5'-bis(diphosphate) 3'-pyrophosphohydrolase [Candidatus Olsenella avicola]|uniref:RelA/SpoT family protein n=1 Tax=Olsenella sp. An285 TaxID=1965621 RepID=UPI000B37F180|nr:bifunctional (p)ppGpp synthetase/guanosine-3',5'-bis(diphosphate) 3'-pyrophosphohydrolase [Olsenella sp. An285]OUO48639.1 GTP pyrophosphokinase [Olsenella sp. An285]HIY52229.1 bifunctional (p)ppGpp synthetase/guanosine-3',5'-bis(diphosphate) 3'-pyrophosphohydrolase [Candidatus Olsenella avicola]
MPSNDRPPASAPVPASSAPAAPAPVASKPQPKPVPGAANFRLLQSACEAYLDTEGCEKVERAYRFAADYHRDQRRRSGEPYINHPVEVALILAHDLRMDEDTICAALLHDTVEDTPATLDELKELFGETVTDLVDGVTKLTSIQVSSMDAKQAWNLRKMFLAMSRDIRVVIIKLADRLHNMRTLAALPPDRRQFKARETMDVYAPLADRLGISSVKWELEDLAFFWLEPDEYQRVARMVQDSRAQREDDTEAAIKTLDDELKAAGLKNYQITGRPKHLWSIYQKMTRKGREFSDIYDLIALRVITQTVGDCYSALGAVHSLWNPMPGRFKDYIATPKANLYQSLHTTVVGPDGKPIEIQIRTAEMHEASEYGIAAHWLYKKEGNSRGRMSAEDRAIDSTINWIRKTLDWATEDDIDDPHEFLDNLRVDLFEHEIFVFTPKGEVMSLRRDSTPLDFAYAVHTEVGNHCVGAKVNGSVVPLSYKLSMGDRVEILTNKNAKPSRDWMGIVVMPSTRAKIRKFFSTQNRNDDAEAGRTELAHELRKRGYGISTKRTVKAIARVCEHFELRTPDDLFACIHTGKVSVKQAANRIEEILEEGSPEQIAAAAAEAERRAEHERAMATGTPVMKSYALTQAARGKRKRSNCGVVVKGDPDLLVHLAHCCNPVAGDEIVGFITRGRGVSVHRSNCPNVTDLMRNPDRMIEVAWDTSGATEFRVEIVVEATDRMGLLKDITVAIGDAGANILSAATQTSAQGVARLRFLVAISDASLLDVLLSAVSRVPSVYDARRIMPGEGANQMKQRVR